MKYEYTDDMREISGFGGKYEEACRKMVVAGLEWLDKNPEALPKATHNPGIYGIINLKNEDAEKLSKVVVSAVPDCSGAMHQATMSHILRIKEVGWEQYVKDMTE